MLILAGLARKDNRMKFHRSCIFIEISLFGIFEIGVLEFTVRPTLWHNQEGLTFLRIQYLYHLIILESYVTLLLFIDFVVPFYLLIVIYLLNSFDKNSTYNSIIAISVNIGIIKERSRQSSSRTRFTSIKAEILRCITIQRYIERVKRTRRADSIAFTAFSSSISRYPSVS